MEKHHPLPPNFAKQYGSLEAPGKNDRQVAMHRKLIPIAIGLTSKCFSGQHDIWDAQLEQRRNTEVVRQREQKCIYILYFQSKNYIYGICELKIQRLMAPRC